MAPALSTRRSSPRIQKLKDEQAKRPRSKLQDQTPANQSKKKKRRLINGDDEKAHVAATEGINGAHVAVDVDVVFLVNQSKKKKTLRSSNGKENGANGAAAEGTNGVHVTADAEQSKKKLRSSNVKGNIANGTIADVTNGVHVTLDAELSKKKKQNGANRTGAERTNGVHVAVDAEKSKKKKKLRLSNGNEADAAVVDPPLAAAAGVRSDKARVMETLRTFNKHYLHFVQEEEKRCGKVEAERKAVKGSKAKEEEKRGKIGAEKKAAKGSKAKEEKKRAKIGVEKKANKGSKAKKGSAGGDDKRAVKRPDLKALTKMSETNDLLNPESRVGAIPGVDVGHQFFSRAEMVAVGFHSHWLMGIDYISSNASKKYNGYILPLAVSIVISGQYEDDLDNCDDVVYTGQGGNNLVGDRHQIKDQKMERGNLALKNCIEQGTPVRVVRGHQSKTSYVGKVYTYDGLYKVVDYWAEKGLSGYTVYKFRLKRLDGQPLLTTTQVQFARGHIPTSVSEIRGLVCEDITGGLEDIPIPATNLVDDPPVAPTGFIYCKSNQVAKSVKLPKNAIGCDCKGSCTDSRRCACAKLNGSDFPYVNHKGSRLIEPKAIVFECGPNCGCGLNCINRASQGGIKYRLEVFRTPKKGWGVRSWDYIPAGAPVCEYIGVLMRTDEVDTTHENFYMFDIDCLETMKGLDGREKRFVDVSLPEHLKKDDNHHDTSPEFCIDAGTKGNITRFINHSCEPNLFVQCVLNSHHDLRLARVVLFASDSIPPLQELTYDYGYILDSVKGPDGKPKQVACYCGAENCRKRLI